MIDGIDRPEGDRPRVSVIVPLYNGADIIASCLSSVPSDVELIVVDDASQDGAPNIVAANFPAAILLRNATNLGFAATCNRGLHRSRAPVKVLLNSDARLHSGALNALVSSFDDPGVGIAGPRLVFPDGRHQVSAASFPTPFRLFVGGLGLAEVLARVWPRGARPLQLGMPRRDHRVDRDVDWVMGTCLAIHERCLADVVGFDEGYFLYVEETDLCLRASQAGWRVRYVAGGTVEHDIGGSIDDRSDARRELAGEARYMLTHGGRAALGRWRVARTLGAALRIALLAAPALLSSSARTRLRWQASALRNAPFIAPPESGPRFQSSE
ncbi:MAG: glycosyltransferase family 2 protein [Actinomycetota bacterium]